MISSGEFRFSKGGYSLYAQMDAREGAFGMVYAVYDDHEQLMDELPSLGEACALIERLIDAHKSPLKAASPQGNTVA